MTRTRGRPRPTAGADRPARQAAAYATLADDAGGTRWSAAADGPGLGRERWPRRSPRGGRGAGRATASRWTTRPRRSPRWAGRGWPCYDLADADAGGAPGRRGGKDAFGRIDAPRSTRLRRRPSNNLALPVGRPPRRRSSRKSVTLPWPRCCATRPSFADAGGQPGSSPARSTPWSCGCSAGWLEGRRRAGDGAEPGQPARAAGIRVTWWRPAISGDPPKRYFGIRLQARRGYRDTTRSSAGIDLAACRSPTTSPTRWVPPRPWPCDHCSALDVNCGIRPSSAGCIVLDLHVGRAGSTRSGLSDFRRTYYTDGLGGVGP